MQKLFTYGTLQHDDVQEDLFGRTLQGTPETLVGYVLSEIRIEEEFGLVHYPIIMEKAWTYLDTDEILNLKGKTKEIRELK